MKSLLVGDNAFLGISHLSAASAREKLRQLDTRVMLDVISTALKNGATGFTFSFPHPTNSRILEAMRDHFEPEHDFELLPIIPYAESYVRIMNEKGLVGLVEEMTADLSSFGKAKFLIKGGISAATTDPFSMMTAYLDTELEKLLRLKPKEAKFSTILLHEVITDLALSFKAERLFHEYSQHVWNKYHVKPGFATRNFVKLVDFLRESNLLTDIVLMAPFNGLGFQMNPSKAACEASLSLLSNVEVIAVSILAGGYSSLGDAVKYVHGLSNLVGVAVGTSSRAHAESTFSMMRSLLSTQ
jgi:hypothetical protein